ncbi:terminase [Mycolicibacillus trivialis]
MAVRRRVRSERPATDVVMPAELLVYRRGASDDEATAQAAYRRWIRAGEAWRAENGFRALSAAAGTPDAPWTGHGLSGVARRVVAPAGIASTGWPAVAAVCAELGLLFDDWQAALGRLILGKDASGRFAADVAALSVGRQCGKTHLLAGICFALCLIEPGTTAMWTAHRSRTGAEVFKQAQGLAAMKQVKPHIDRVLLGRGEESVTFKNGSRILFGARERGFGRGFSNVSVLIFDEAQILTSGALDDMVPATATAVNPLVVMAGTPPKPSDPAEVFSGLRAEALGDESGAVAYVEIAAAPGASPDDRSQWPLMNPSYPHRTSERAILRMRKALGEDSFRREAMGVWPEVSPHEPVVKPSVWAALVDVGPPDGTAPNALGVDMSHGRDICVAGAWLEGESVHVERVFDSGDVAAAVDWIAARATRRMPVVVDSVSPAAALVPELKARKVAVRVTSAGDMGRACGGFLDRINSGTISHGGEDGLTAALVGARKRPIRDAGGFGWDRRDPTSSIYPLVAATLAVFGAVDAPRRQRSGRAVFV